MLTNLKKYATITMSKDGKKERKEKTMKTYEIVKMSKGYYVSTRINGRATARDYFKTKGAMTARIAELKKMGYALA